MQAIILVSDYGFDTDGAGHLLPSTVHRVLLPLLISSVCRWRAPAVQRRQPAAWKFSTLIGGVLLAAESQVAYRNKNYPVATLQHSSLHGAACCGHTAFFLFPFLAGKSSKLPYRAFANQENNNP